MDYKKGIVHSFEGLKNHVELFIPDIVLYFLVFVVSALYYKFGGLAELVRVMIEQGTFYNEVILRVFSENIATFLTSTLVFILSAFVFGVGTDVVKFDMMKDLVENKRPSLTKSWRKRKDFFVKYLVLKLMVYLFAFVLGFLVVMLAYLLSFSAWSETMAFVIIIVLSLLAFFLFKLGIMFSAPLLFLEKKRPDQAFGKSLQFMVRKTKHLLVVGAIILFFFLMFTLLETTVGTVLGFMQDAFVSQSTLYLGFFMVSFVPFLVKLIYKLWAELFVFENRP